MIPIVRVDEPDDFDRKVRRQGQAWLRANRNAVRPKALWSEFTGTLANGFDNLCGYAAMFDPTGGTIDHFLSYKSRPDLAYEWSNYRFASAPLNSSKKTADDTVLDPYEVRPGWFEIILPSLQMRITDSVPDEIREKALYTLTRLKLRDGERVIRWRRSWYEMYQRGELSLSGLQRVAPLIAEAIERQSSGTR